MSKDYSVRFIDGEYNTQDSPDEIIAGFNSDVYYTEALSVAKDADEVIRRFCMTNDVKCQVLYDPGCLHFKKIVALVPSCKVSINFSWKHPVAYTEDIPGLLSAIIEKEIKKTDVIFTDAIWESVALKHSGIQNLMRLFPESMCVFYQANRYTKSIDLSVNNRFLYTIQITDDFIFYSAPDHYEAIMGRISDIEEIQWRIAEYAYKLQVDGRFDCNCFVWLDSVRVIITAKMFAEKMDPPLAEFSVTKETLPDLDRMFSDAINELLSVSGYYGTIIVEGKNANVDSK